MKLRRLQIDHFRGIEFLDWRHIPETAALVGPGDSGKTTILEAIDRVLSPKWNVPFDDTDFWELDTERPIIIRATITDLAPAFYRDTKFGLLLHAFDASAGEAAEIQGKDDEIHALIIQLQIDRSLEPKWSVVDADEQLHPMSARDREALGMLRVGGFVDQHLGWSRGSVLARLTDSGDAVGAVLAEASRQARSGLKMEGLERLKTAAERVQTIARHIGVAPTHALAPSLDAASLTVAAGALSLHDGKVPLRRAGLGTRRLLAVGMEREAASDTGLTIIDEFEHGLEPHRIRRLLRVLRGRAPEGVGLASGQLIFTTHSPTVLSELSANEVAVTRRTESGVVVVFSAPNSIDYVLKRAPEALLAHRVIVAEGATEVGISQAMDEAWTNETGGSFGYRGVVVVDGDGSSQPAEIAGHLVQLGYKVALFVDSDVNAKTGRAKGAEIIAWPGKMCTEQRLSADLPVSAIERMVEAAEARCGRRVSEALADHLKIPRASLPAGDAASWIRVAGIDAFRSAFGDVAKHKNHAWFKSRAQGEFLGQLIVEHWSELGDSPTQAVIARLRSFADG